MTFRVGLAGLGQMGRKFYAALEQLAGGNPGDIDISVYDPFAQETVRATRFDDENAFYQSKQDLFVIATHPHTRHLAIQELANTSAQILMEKPLGTVQICEGAMDATDLESVIATLPTRTRIHFLEQWDPLTYAAVEILHGKVDGLPSMTVDRMELLRRKDRETNLFPLENQRHTEPIILQEGVHDITFASWLLNTSATPQILGVKSGSLQHPSRGEMPFCGYVDCDLVYTVGERKVPVHIINSYKGSGEYAGQLTKSKRIFAHDCKGDLYVAHINHLEGARELSVFKNGKLSYIYSGENTLAMTSVDVIRHTLHRFYSAFKGLPALDENGTALQSAYNTEQVARTILQAQIRGTA